MEAGGASTQSAAPDLDTRPVTDPDERTSAGGTIQGPARRPPAPIGPAPIQARQGRRIPGNTRFVCSKARGVTLLACIDRSNGCIDLTDRARRQAGPAAGEDRLGVKGVRPGDLAPRNFVF